VWRHNWLCIKQDYNVLGDNRQSRGAIGRVNKITRTQILATARGSTGACRDFFRKLDTIRVSAAASGCVFAVLGEVSRSRS